MEAYAFRLTSPLRIPTWFEIQVMALAQMKLLSYESMYFVYFHAVG